MRKGHTSVITGLLLIAAALCFAGYNIFDTMRAGSSSDEMLTELLPQIAVDPIPAKGRPVNILPAQSVSASDERQPENTEIEYPDYVINPNMEMPEGLVNGYSCIGVLRIPALELELPIISEWDYTKLKTSPCRYSGSVYLDNMTICAHNYRSHFGLLRELRIDDTVTFTDMDGNEFVYHVAEVEILQPTAIEEMMNNEWDLTLFTCTIGGTSRVTVRCEKAAI